MFYFGRTYTTTVSGSLVKAVRCTGCGSIYNYKVSGSAQGKGHSPYLLDETGAKARSAARAHESLDGRLQRIVLPVHCPRCGVFQPDMLVVLRSRYGGDADFNAFPKLRVQKNIYDLLRETKSEDTVEAYARFLQVWPHVPERSKIELLMRRKQNAMRVARWKARLARLLPKPGRAPRPESSDDLTLITGIDADCARQLNAHGVRQYAQIAAWTPGEVEQMSAALGLQGRIREESWVGQAKTLTSRYERCIECGRVYDASKSRHCPRHPPPGSAAQAVHDELRSTNGQGPSASVGSMRGLARGVAVTLLAAACISAAAIGWMSITRQRAWPLSGNAGVDATAPHPDARAALPAAPPPAGVSLPGSPRLQVSPVARPPQATPPAAPPPAVGVPRSPSSQVPPVIRPPQATSANCPAGQVRTSSGHCAVACRSGESPGWNGCVER